MIHQLKNQIKKLRLSPVEKGTLVYIITTTVYLAIFIEKVDIPLVRFGIRACVTFLIILLAWVCMRRPHPVVKCLRYFLPFALLSYWYPETYYCNNFIFSHLDHYLFAAEQAIFGCQPSLEFSKHLPWAWFSELMYFGYFSYYFIFFGTALWCYIKDKEQATRAVFMFVCSFYLYYWMFIVFPTAGPHLYFELFPPPLNQAPEGYIFCNIMHLLQELGDRPTGAFPSSHVSISFTVVVFSYYHCRQLLKFVLPLFIILFFSTVYIKAHYAIDAIGGLVSVAATYPLVNWIYKKGSNNAP